MTALIGVYSALQGSLRVALLRGYNSKSFCPVALRFSGLFEHRWTNKTILEFFNFLLSFDFVLYVV